MRHRIVLGVGRAVVMATWIASSAMAQDFSLQVGPPVAGQGQPAKSSLLVVRPGGCADPATAQITATAEGIVDGARRSVPLRLSALQAPGVHAVPKDVAGRGVWVINLVGTCAGKAVGAIVSLVGSNPEYRREAVKYFPHPATPSEIDASLKVLVPGSRQ